MAGSKDFPDEPWEKLLNQALAGLRSRVNENGQGQFAMNRALHEAGFVHSANMIAVYLRALGLIMVLKRAALGKPAVWFVDMLTEVTAEDVIKARVLCVRKVAPPKQTLPSSKRRQPRVKVTEGARRWADECNKVLAAVAAELGPEGQTEEGAPFNLRKFVEDRDFSQQTLKYIRVIGALKTKKRKPGEGVLWQVAKKEVTPLEVARAHIQMQKNKQARRHVKDHKLVAVEELIVRSTEAAVATKTRHGSQGTVARAHPVLPIPEIPQVLPDPPFNQVSRQYVESENDKLYDGLMDLIDELEQKVADSATELRSMTEERDHWRSQAQDLTVKLANPSAARARDVLRRHGREPVM